MDTAEFEYDLPADRIAQTPAEPRDASKLLLCEAAGRLGEWSGSFRYSDRAFRELPDLLGPGDLLVVNDARVLPVRILGKRVAGGGAVEALLLSRVAPGEWSALMHLSARIKPGMEISFEPGVLAEVLSTHEERIAHEGEVRLMFRGLALERGDPSERDALLEGWLEKHGHVPLPPYIERPDRKEDRATYQTVYARRSGSAAAPTAGFHFTDELLRRLADRGVGLSRITLHVGLGTFRPIKAATLEGHEMHEERYEIPEAFVAEYLASRSAGRRVVAVGTTVVRALESWMADGGDRPGVFSSRLFLRPGSRFHAVDDLITNFHLPRSSLLVMIAAAMGMEPMREAYRRALAGGYRFYSYGDAMFIRGTGR